jgi:hypothetical protein
LSLLSTIADAILCSSERVLRLVVEGASLKRGKSPKWLENALNLEITGIAKGSTVLNISAPTFQESIPDYFAQKKIWKPKLIPEDTAISLFSKSMSDIVSGNLESDLYDYNVLQSLNSFRNILKKHASELNITSSQKKADNCRISSDEITKIGEVKVKIPESRIVALSGFFNMIEHDHRRFQLKVNNEQIVDGYLDPKFIDIEDMRPLWGKKVTIKGKALFKPSGRIHSIDVQKVRAFELGDEILGSIPQSQGQFKFSEEFIHKQNAQAALKKVWGKWPGEESMDEILEALSPKIN